MTREMWVRRLAALALTLSVATGLGAAASGTAHAVAPTDAQRATTTERAATQRVTFLAPHCDGCRMRVYSAVFDAQGEPDVWQSAERRVAAGRVTFRVPAGRTRGLSASVTAPWEGQTGYVTHVAFRYLKVPVGQRVRVEQARAKQSATACWAGTGARATTLRLVTRKVTVEGVHGPTPGTLVFTRVTQRAMAPMRRAYDGVLGSQDLNICGKR